MAAKKRRTKIVAFRVLHEDAGIIKKSVWKILTKKQYKRYGKKDKKAGGSKEAKS